jgi:hypothetical protein
MTDSLQARRAGLRQKKLASDSYLYFDKRRPFLKHT